MTTSNTHELSETVSIRVTKRDKELLEKICRARGEDPSDFVRRAVRKEFAILCYLPNEEKKALGFETSSSE